MAYDFSQMLQGALYPDAQMSRAAQGSPNGPTSPPNPMQAAMEPQEDPSALQAFYSRMKARPDSGAINDGLINAGVGLLSGENLQQGLAKGFAGFNAGYDAKQDKDRELNAPKVIPMADGAFTMLAFPNGTQKVVKNSEVSDYLTGQKEAAARAKAADMVLQANLNNQGKIATENRASAKEAQTALTGVDANIAVLKSLSESDGPIQNHSLWGQIQALPLIRNVAEMVGTKESIDNRKLTEATVDEVLRAGAQLKGASSDKDMAYLRSSKPSPEASAAVWKDWAARSLAASTRIQEKLNAQIAQGQASGSPVSPGGGVLSPRTAPAAQAPNFGAMSKYLD